MNSTIDSSLPNGNTSVPLPSIVDLANRPFPAPTVTSGALVTALQASIQSRLSKNIWFVYPPNVKASPHAIDFSLGDYLSFTSSDRFRKHLLDTINRSPDILGSGGTRVLVNPHSITSLEARLESFFHVPTGGALLCQSGYTGNLTFLSAVPQPGDVVVYDEFIHASMHHGLQTCQAEKQVSFKHNDLGDLRRVLGGLVGADSDLGSRLRGGTSTVLLVVESLYSMDGTIACLAEQIRVLEELLPLGNGVMFIDEAHATGLYGPQGRGRVAFEGLENHPRILGRLCTFGKALGNSGGEYFLACICLQ